MHYIWRRTATDYCTCAQTVKRNTLKKCICLLGSGGATRGDQIQWRAFWNPQWTQKECQTCVTNQRRCINYAAQHSHSCTFNCILCLFKSLCLYEDRFSQLYFYESLEINFLITLMFHGGIMQLHVNHRRLGNDLV